MGDVAVAITPTMLAAMATATAVMAGLGALLRRVSHRPRHRVPALKGLPYVARLPTLTRPCRGTPGAAGLLEPTGDSVINHRREPSLWDRRHGGAS